MSQNTLKVHDLNEDAEFDENGIEVFDEKALVEEEPSDSDLAEEELLSQGATQRVLDATQLYLGEIGYSPLLTAEEEVYFARRALRGDVASRRRMIESNLRLVVNAGGSVKSLQSVVNAVQVVNPAFNIQHKEIAYLGLFRIIRFSGL